jgi:hypothetical protein
LELETDEGAGSNGRGFFIIFLPLGHYLTRNMHRLVHGIGRK